MLQVDATDANDVDDDVNADDRVVDDEEDSAVEVDVEDEVNAGNLVNNVEDNALKDVVDAKNVLEIIGKVPNKLTIQDVHDVVGVFVGNVDAEIPCQRQSA